MRALKTRRQTSSPPSPATRALLALVGDMSPALQNDGSDGGGGGDGGDDGGSRGDRNDDFGINIESHRERLYRRALRLSGKPDVAEDLVQTTLLRALQRSAQFQPGTHLETWLVKMLTNLFLDMLRHEKVERNAEPDLAALSITDCELDCNLAIVSDPDLYEAVQSLEPELRDVVELCCLKRMRYRDAAAQLGLANGTVATRLMRARERLRRRLTTTSRKP